MTLPSSGAISMSQVNTELGAAETTQRSLGDTVVRNLFGVPSGAISMSDGYGKSSISVAWGNGNNFSWTGYNQFAINRPINFNPDGSITNNPGVYYATVVTPGSFVTPLTAAYGANLQMQLTITSYNTNNASVYVRFAGNNYSAVGSTFWANLSSTVQVDMQVANFSSAGSGSASGMVNIRRASDGVVLISRAWSMSMSV